MITPPILNYVGSGMTHTRICDHNAFNDPVVSDIIRHVSSSIQGRNGHLVSVLFNAYIEEKLAPIFDIYFKGAMEDIHADSGGLQIVTLGKVISKELKTKIYKIQAKGSDMAMGFDEIPVNTFKDKNKINTKSFDQSLLDDCAIQTRSNLKEQLQYFVENDSRAKVLPILQGNSESDYVRWHQLLLKDISKDEQSKIAGLALGFAAYGKGSKPMVHIIRMLKNLETEEKMIHLLGVGSISRMLPLIILIKSGYLGNKYSKISYDSTSHTQASSFGAYLKKNDNQINVKRYKTPSFYEVWEDISVNMKEFIDWIESKYDIEFCEETLFHTICQQSKYRDWGKHKREYRGVFTFIFFISQVLNFTWTVNECLHNEDFLKMMIHQYDPGLRYLMAVKDDYDLSNWFANYESKEKKVKNYNETDADGLF